MLGKLLKHEWKASWRVPTLLIGILFAAALLAAIPFMLPIWDSKWIGLPLSAMMLVMLFYFAMIAVSVGVVIYIGVRYYKSMFTDEGYLTHTLPVSAHQLFLSKVITMSLWNLLAMFAIVASLFLFVGTILMFMATPQELRMDEFFEQLQVVLQSEYMAGWEAFLACVLIIIPVGSISGAIMLAASITLGQMVRKHRILGAVGAYFIIVIANQILMTLFLIPVYVRIFVTDTTDLAEMSLFAVYVPMYVVIIGISVAVSTGLYILSDYLVRKKLELE